ncbi:MAG TPA: UbiD family decarboxylase [Acidobacteriota bacterium]|nr:UbiD family decarboxylase [Acidobacteriota bacterium]
MRHPNLRAYLETLTREGELHRVEEPVDPHLELAEIHRRVVARQGPALLFTRVARTAYPVVTNLFGTRRRIDLAFGEDPLRFFSRLTEAAQSVLQPSLAGIWNYRDLIGTALRVGTKSTASGPVIEKRVTPPRLKLLPQIQCWPRDGGPFLTLPVTYTEHPVTGRANLGMYRNQIYDDTTAGMHFQIHRGIGFHYYEAERIGSPLPANVFLGGPPALMLSAIAPLPENVPEVMLASLLQGGRLSLIRNPRISALPLVAEADFALIGKIPPQARRTEGPFGDHYGYYSLEHPFPVFEVEDIYHRKDAVFPATVVGRPRQEDHYIGEYLQELFSPLFPLVMNGVVSVWAYDDAGVHTLASAIVRERYRREAFMAAMRILGEGQLSLTKFLMVTDGRVPLKDFRTVLVHILERADFATDLFVFSNVSQDTLDYTSGILNEGSKAILMGLGEKRYQLTTQVSTELHSPIFRRQACFAPGVLVVEGPPWHDGDTAIADLVREDAVRAFRLICLVDDAADCTRDDPSFLWTVFTRFEPAADICARESRLDRFHVNLSAPLVLDCRLKPWYPPPVEPLPETVARVDVLWPKIFARGF